MNKKTYYALKAYGMRGHPFPAFWDNYPTLTSARKAAQQALKDGWQTIELFKDAPLPHGHTIGITRELIETLGAEL